MPPSSVKSRPQFAELRPDPTGRRHLLIGHGDGGAALLRLLRELTPADDRQVIYSAEPRAGFDHAAALAACEPASLIVRATRSEAINALAAALAESGMGLRLYAAGSESFLGSVDQAAAKYDLRRDEIQREHCGSSARRVFCVHCQASNPDVTTNLVPCGGCGRRLLVRDHYSRRLASYMGVMVDAEVPGALPELREVFA